MPQYIMYFIHVGTVFAAVIRLLRGGMDLRSTCTLVYVPLYTVAKGGQCEHEMLKNFPLLV